MKKLLIIISLLLFTPFVKAEDITYELCKSGCDYSDLNTIQNAIYQLDSSKVYDITIDIKDGETYELLSNTRNYFNGETDIQKSTITYKGPSSNHPTIGMTSTSSVLRLFNAKSVYIENIDFDTVGSIDLQVSYSPVVNGLERTLSVKNSNVKAREIFIDCRYLNMENANLVSSSFISFQNTEDTTYTVKNTTVKANVDNASPQTDLDIAGTGIFTNTTFEAKHRINAADLTLNNCTVKADDHMTVGGKQVYKNTKIDTHIDMGAGNHSLDNVEMTRGLTISGEYCVLGDEGNQVTMNIKDSKITNENGEAIYINIREKYKLNIDNTELNNSYCSIGADIPKLETCNEANIGGKKLLPTFISAEKDASSIVVTNSKVNCAITGSNDTNINAVSIYFDYTNTWSGPITRLTEFGDLNGNELSGKIIEQNKGSIYIEAGAEDILKLNVDLEKDIADYFKDILPEGSVLGEWFIEDESILKVVDGKIIPLKVGTTAIYSVIDNNVYSVYITVTEDMVNPETGGSIMNVIILTIVLGSIALILHFKRPNKITE